MNALMIDKHEVSDFKILTAKDVKEATYIAIQKARENLDSIYKINSKERTFENTMRSLDDIYNDLMKVNETISLLAYVHPIDEIRNQCLESTAEFGKFFNEISLSEDLYNAVKV
jgi:Zn-dependent oligopeptidase